VQIILTALRMGPPDHTLHTHLGKSVALIEQNCQSAEFQLRTIRAILKHLSNPSAADDLEGILVRGHSGYAVRMDKLGLEFRVSPTVREQIEAAVEQSPEAINQLLVKAWNNAYGLEQHPDVAFMLAVQAAEAAVRKVISPDDGAGKLGKMIRACEAKPSKWAFAVTESRDYFDTGKDEPLDGIQAVIQLMRLLSYGQRARHPGEDSDVNTVQQARAAVNAAVVLVMWSLDGTFRRVDSD
jgi:hypothetical protein